MFVRNLCEGVIAFCMNNHYKANHQSEQADQLTSIDFRISSSEPSILDVFRISFSKPSILDVLRCFDNVYFANCSFVTCSKLCARHLTSKNNVVGHGSKLKRHKSKSCFAIKSFATLKSSMTITITEIKTKIRYYIKQCDYILKQFLQKFHTCIYFTTCFK